MDAFIYCPCSQSRIVFWCAFLCAEKNPFSAFRKRKPRNDKAAKRKMECGSRRNNLANVASSCYMHDLDCRKQSLFWCIEAKFIHLRSTDSDFIAFLIREITLWWTMRMWPLLGDQCRGTQCVRKPISCERERAHKCAHFAFGNVFINHANDQRKSGSKQHKPNWCTFLCLTHWHGNSVFGLCEGWVFFDCAPRHKQYHIL